LRVGIHAGSSNADQIAEQCRQVGVEDVFLRAQSVPGFTEQGYLSADKVAAFKDALAERGIRMSGMITPVPSKESVLGENEAEVEALCKTFRAMGEAGVEATLFYPLDKFIYFHEYHPGKPFEVMPGDEQWGLIIEFFKEVVGAADEVGLKLANHTWPFEVMEAIWKEVGSPNNGVTFCQGMYIFGEDPHVAVERWGIDRIFFCHARTLVRHGPSFQEFEEVPLDKGDVDIPLCIRALIDAGYDGVIAPEHLGKDASMADAITYLKKLINE